MGYFKGLILVCQSAVRRCIVPAIFQETTIKQYNNDPILTFLLSHFHTFLPDLTIRANFRIIALIERNFV